MNQTKGNTIDEVSASGNMFLKSLLQVEDLKLTCKEKEECVNILHQIVIHSEITIDKISN